MSKKSKYRLRIVYEKLESAFDEPDGITPNPYYDGLVNFELLLENKIFKGIDLANCSNKTEVNKWKNRLNKQGRVIKGLIEEFLKISDKEYNYFIGFDSQSLYLSFKTKSEFNRWNRSRIIDDILE